LVRRNCGVIGRRGRITDVDEKGKGTSARRRAIAHQKRTIQQGRKKKGKKKKTSKKPQKKEGRETSLIAGGKGHLSGEEKERKNSRERKELGIRIAPRPEGPV